MSKRRFSAISSSPKRSLDSLANAITVARVAADNRGRDVVLLDMRKLTSLFDFFIVATGGSRRQLHAIAEEIDRVMEKELGDRRLGMEGYEASRWIVLDYGDIVVHLFDDEMRDYYALEQLWGDASRVAWERPGEDGAKAPLPSEAKEGSPS